LHGWRILHLLTATATAAEHPGSTIDRALARAWGVDARGLDFIRGALILCADHELNVSAFTARCVASAGSNPYAVVTAGLAALEGTKHGGSTAPVEATTRARAGTKHGGSTARVEATLAAMRRERSLRTAFAERLRQGQRIDGFGHPLY